MAKLVSAKCPNCGGSVRIEPQLDHVTCRFCGTSAFIEGRTHAPLAPNEPVFRMQPAAIPNPAIFLVPLGLVVVLGVIGLFSASLGGGTAGLGAGRRLVSGWTQPMVGDANGDGVGDIITWTQLVGGRTVRIAIAAFDGRNGKELWRTDELGQADAQYNMATAVVGDRLLLADPEGRLHGHALATGKRLWTAALGERVERYCEHETLVEVVVKDGKRHWLDPKTGSRSKPPAQPTAAGASPSTGGSQQEPEGWCERYSSDERQSAAGVQRMSWSDEELRRHPLPTIDDMSTSTVLRRRTGPWLVLGNRSSGTRVPMVAATEGNKVLWSLEAPTANPLSVQEGAPELATIVGGRAFVVYHTRSPRGSRLTAITLRDGKRIWDRGLPLAENEEARQIATTERLVLVSDRTSIVAVAIADGAVRFTVR